MPQKQTRRARSNKGTAAGRFAHLHLHTEYSILDGAISIPRLMEELARTGMPAAAITDHGNLFGAVEFHEAARQAGVRPIIGCEVYVAQGSRFDRDPETGGFDGINHLILLAMNQTGYQNLIRLVSKGYLEGFYYKPRIDFELLSQHAEGLIATSGCLSGAVPSQVLKGREQQAWDLVDRYSKLFQGRYYLELQRHGIELQDTVNRVLLQMHEELRLPLLATNDCHYLHAHDARPHEALLCVQTGKTLDDPKRFRFNGEGFYVKDPAEMLEVFHDHPEAVTNSIEVAERCEFEFETGKLQLPEFEVPSGESLDGYLEGLALRGLRTRLGLEPEPEPGAPALPSDAAEYEQRLRYEIDVIQRCGYSGYFLIVADLIRFAREREIPVGPGRGSSAGSLVAWALEITGIDPVDFTIPFERFLNPERVSMPDIDVDFCMNRRHEVIAYVEQKYNGEDEESRRVAGIVTFGTMQAKGAIRDVGRVLGMPYPEVDRIAKLIPNTLGVSLEQAMEGRELRELVARDPAVAELCDLARSLEGQVRHPSKHAAGVVISSRPLIDTVPLYCDARDRDDVVTQFDYRSAEKVGLIKFDLLGLRTLTIMADAERRIREAYAPDFSLDGVAADDSETYALLRTGDTEGIFQVGLSKGMTDLVVKVRPNHLRDLVPLIALYRPGPLQSGMVDDFVSRKHGRTPVEYLLPELEEILAETVGVIVYQDQVLQIANRLASFSLGEGDLLRRAMGKKIPAEMEQQRTRFLDGCTRNGFPLGKATQIFDLMNQFSGYGFPKAHSAAYALITHQTAYLKAHYPAVFLAALMTAEWRDHDKLDRYVRDARGRGIEILPPCVNRSAAEFRVTSSGDAIRFGLCGVKNIGEGAVDSLVAQRSTGDAFQTIYDFCRRLDGRRVNRRAIESLIRCGAFDCLKVSRASLWAVLEQAIEAGQRAQRDRESGQRSLFGEAGGPAEVRVPEVPEWPEPELLAGEKQMLGIYMSGHPLRSRQRELDQLASVTSDRISDQHRGLQVRMAGMLSALDQRKTRKGATMARGVLEDLGGSVDVVFLPDAFERNSELLRSTDPLLVRGRLQMESERSELLVDEVVLLGEGYARWTRELHLCLDHGALTPERLRVLRETLDLVPGEVPVVVRLALPSGAEAVLELTRHRVAVSTDLIDGLERLFEAPVVECQLS